MRYFDESVIHDYGDEVTHRFFDLWHQECLSCFKQNVEIIMFDRMEHPDLRKMDGTVNTASPGVFDEKFRLALWLEDISTHPPDPITVTHEIGHWILFLRGYKSIVDPKNISSENVISLNSLVQHPPLHALQRFLGHDPQDMIDNQTEIDTNFWKEFKERDPRRWVSDALYITDHLINCSDNHRHKLNNLLNKRMPNVRRIVLKVMDLIDNSDLLTPENNWQFLKKLVKRCNFHDWIEFDQLELFKKHLG